MPIQSDIRTALLRAGYQNIRSPADAIQMPMRQEYDFPAYAHQKLVRQR